VIEGFLLGVAIGDSVCLPYEGLSAARAGRRLDRKGLRQSLVGRWGMLSDDTEQTALVAQSFLEAGANPRSLGRAFARRLRWWFLALPGGIGLATARACIKLCMGKAPEHSGVNSAGSGPAMRAGLLGLLVDDESLIACVRAITIPTHADPRALQGALIVAVGARLAMTHGSGVSAAMVRQAVTDFAEAPDLREALEHALSAAEHGETATALTDRLRLSGRVTGFVVHVVPVALYLWLRHTSNPERALEEAIRLGGDTDTVGSIAAGLIGAGAGPGAFPPELAAGIADWPRSVRWLKSLASRLAEGPPHPLSLFWPMIPLRNLVFIAIVVCHGLRRLIPL